MPSIKVTHAVRLALVASAAACSGFVTTEAFAQEATLEEVVVTGSRIRVESLDTPRPVVMVTREVIEQQGFAQLTDILQNLTTTGTPPLTRASPLSAGEAAGGQYLSLRDLGANRTLILVDGKRVGVTTGGLQDISIIPVAMIERVEVLKDGASSVYGSDAIGGVVNILTRRNFDGIQFNAYLGQFDEGDGATQRYDFVLGHRGERGSMTLGGEWATEARVAAADRPFSAFPRGQFYPTHGWTTVGQFGGWNSTGAQAIPGLSGRVVLREGGNPLRWQDFRLQNQVLQGPNASTLDKSNTLEQTDLRTPLERKTIFVNGNFEFMDNLRFVGSASYSQRESSRQVAGFPMQADANTILTPMAANSYFNPIGTWHGFATPVPIANWWRRTWEVPRVSTANVDNLRFTGAVEGTFDWADRNFTWDVGYLFSSNDNQQVSFGNLNLFAVSRAVGPSFLNAQGQVQCGTPAAPILFGTTANTCIPWNPFLAAGQVGPGGLTNNPQLADYLFQNETATGRTHTRIYNANLTGSVLELPAGDLQFAVGIERREERGRFVPDALSVTGISTNLGARPTVGEYNVNEIYAEVLVPVLSGLPAVHSLNVTAAVRYSDFDTFGETTKAKYGLQWQPLDQVLVRASFAEGFRAPTIANLFAGGSQTFSFYTDPCDPVFGVVSTDAATRTRCAAAIASFATFRQLQQGFVPATSSNAQTPVAFFSGAANPLLTPEESESITAGVVWSPEQWGLSGLQVAVDWWNIRIENTIVADSPTLILDDCYVQGIASRCQLFTRDPARGFVNAMNFGSRNAGFAEVQGIDLDLSYNLPTRFGTFGLASQTTYLQRDRRRSTNDPQVVPNENIGFAAAAGTTHRTRSNLSLSWNHQSFGFTWGTRYYSGLTEACLNLAVYPEQCNAPNTRAPIPTVVRNNNRLGSNTFHDVQLRWTAPWDGVVSVGANNVLNHEAHQMYSTPNSNVPYNGAFDIGRFGYFRYQQNF